MQGVNALVGPVHLIALEIHLIASQAREGIEAVTLVRPPAVHAEIDQRLVIRPIAAHVPVRRPLAIGSPTARLGSGAAVGYAAAEAPAFEYHVQDDFAMLV